MSITIDPPHSVLLVVGREQFAPPSSFGDATCVATADCVAVSIAEGPALLELAPAPHTSGLRLLDAFTIESEGLVSVRDVYGRELDTLGVPPGWALVTLWGDCPRSRGTSPCRSSPSSPSARSRAGWPPGRRAR